jgi:GMP synthase-like glutamine amidotransferase
MHLLILEHEPDTPAALLADWADARGHSYELAAVPELVVWPEPEAYDAVISLGSDSSVHANPHDWIDGELELLCAAHGADVPVLGICFGGQALARALGARVGAAARAEVGWGPVETDAPELVMPGPWFSWHADEFATPEGGRVLAGTHARTTSFACERSLALQYHPEVDARLARAWINGGRAKLVAQGIDPDEVLAQIDRNGPDARDRAFEQFDRITAWWDGSSSLAATQPAQKETR